MRTFFSRKGKAEMKDIEVARARDKEEAFLPLLASRGRNASLG
jgi:hypothetical protein